MSPEDALARQIEKYRSMTGEERFELGLRLHELSCEVTRAGIRHQHPDFTEEDVAKELRRRILLSHRP